MDKTGALLREPYDWSDELGGLRPPTLLIYGDADNISPGEAARFYALLGGGLADPGWNGHLPPGPRLAILPGATHYAILDAEGLAPTVAAFTD